MILSLKNISKNFGSTKVLDNISLELEKGEILTILGRSGSGKSTILNLISGFEREDSGTISVYEKLVNSPDVFIEPHERNIGFVFQNYGLFPHLNVFKNISFGISKLSRKDQQKIVDDMLKLTGLQGLEKRYPHELSGGQQQRVALARTLATKPKLILFDEVFSNVDSILKTKIQKELLNIIKSSGISAIFVTHDSKEALVLSDKVAYLEEGKIVQFCSPSTIYNSPHTKSVSTFFGKANFIENGGVSYCVRPEECVICDNGAFRAKVANIHYLGERQEVELHFEHENKFYKFIAYLDKNFKLEENDSINFDIVWENCNIL